MSANLFIRNYKSELIQIGYEQQSEGGCTDSGEAIRILTESNPEAADHLSDLDGDEILIVETKAETLFDAEFGTDEEGSW